MGQLGGVHLAGSIPLASAAEVFLTLATELGDRISRMPDGETGNRALFILWQGEQAFARNPAFQQVRGILKPRAFRPYELRAGVDPTQISFPPLGYAEAALSSYAVFRQLKDEGVIPPGIRFQVSLPTPLNILSMVISRRDMGQVEATYEAALLAEVDQIIKAIPSQELAIQWDAPYEVRVWMDRVPLFMSSPWFENQREYVLRTLTRLGEHIPVPVELGYHLCYGDYSNTDNLFFMLMGIPKSKLIRRLGGGLLNRLARRFLGPPSDATAVTEIASGLARSVVRRPIDFIHLPVPRRADDGYFTPLKVLERQEGTALYLGLVHLSDGLEGTMLRIAAAERVGVGNFGVATECGWGRCRPEEMTKLLQLHQAVSQPVHCH